MDSEIPRPAVRLTWTILGRLLTALVSGGIALGIAGMNGAPFDVPYFRILAGVFLVGALVGFVFGGKAIKLVGEVLSWTG